MTTKNATTTTLNYSAITDRSRALWTRMHGGWAQNADGTAVDLWAPDAVTFSKHGAILRAIEEVVGRGQSTSRHLTTVVRRLDAVERADCEHGIERGVPCVACDAALRAALAADGAQPVRCVRCSGTGLVLHPGDRNDSACGRCDGRGFVVAHDGGVR